MAHRLPQVITPGSLQDSADAWANDAENLGAITALMGRWRPLYQAWGENSGIGQDDPTILRTSAMSASDSNGPHYIFPVTSADLTIPNMTLQFRLVASMVIGSDEPDTTVTFGIYPFTGAGTGSFSPVVGTVVTGSTVAIDGNTQDLALEGVGSAFTPPANGAYAFGVRVAAFTASTLDYSYHLQLQYRHV